MAVSETAPLLSSHAGPKLLTSLIASLSAAHQSILVNPMHGLPPPGNNCNYPPPANPPYHPHPNKPEAIVENHPRVSFENEPGMSFENEQRRSFENEQRRRFDTSNKECNGANLWRSSNFNQGAMRTARSIPSGRTDLYHDTRDIRDIRQRSSPSFTDNTQSHAISKTPYVVSKTHDTRDIRDHHNRTKPCDKRKRSPSHTRTGSPSPSKHSSHQNFDSDRFRNSLRRSHQNSQTEFQSCVSDRPTKRPKLHIVSISTSDSVNRTTSDNSRKIPRKETNRSNHANDVKYARPSPISTSPIPLNSASIQKSVTPSMLQANSAASEISARTSSVLTNSLEKQNLLKTPLTEISSSEIRTVVPSAVAVTGSAVELDRIAKTVPQATSKSPLSAENVTKPGNGCVPVVWTLPWTRQCTLVRKSLVSHHRHRDRKWETRVAPTAPSSRWRTLGLVASKSSLPVPVRR